VQDTNPATAEKFIVGLGNPGRQYENTRHNIGFRVVAELARRWQAGSGRQAFDGLLFDARFSRSGAGEKRVRLLCPMTYMNRSGQSVRKLADFYKADRRNVLVVLDDLALPTGRLRIRESGSAGGHNGLSDILAAMGGVDVPRLRIGIGANPPGMDSADYVLSSFTAGERETVEEAVWKAADAAEDWVFESIADVMNRWNVAAEKASDADDK
jgi:PTH1 family peptidyl-tRNA hydrolase